MRHKNSEKEERQEMTKYIYSVPDCPRCDKLKDKYKAGRVSFVERSGGRLGKDPRMFDLIDKEAFLKIQMQNQMFPVEVEMEV